jgi:menaquinone-specific isochorismate synthase
VTAPALLSVAGGVVDPSRLLVHTAAIDDAALARFAEVAAREGRIFERDGLAIAALGLAAHLELPGGLTQKGAATEAVALLRSIPAHHAAPIALGALPFDSRRPTRFAVPECTVVLRDSAPGVAILFGTSERIADVLDAFPFTGPGPDVARELPPDSFTLTSVRSHADYRSRVADAVGAIGRGELDKVVLAREIAITANRPFAQGELVRRLRQLHPGCATFSIDGFLGASPELLVRRSGHAVLSVPLAGTIARSGDPVEEATARAALLESAKDRREHAFVVDAIVDALESLGHDVVRPTAPVLLDLRNVLHLASTIHAQVAEEISVLDCVAALHPTPAVGGAPREAALAYLDRCEDLDRDRYAGPVGWFDATGDGEFYLGIRAAMLDGPSARLIAGAGIVAGSDPDSELAETQLKLQAFLAAAVRP